jgi:hypothetical protein
MKHLLSNLSIAIFLSLATGQNIIAAPWDSKDPDVKTLTATYEGLGDTSGQVESIAKAAASFTQKNQDAEVIVLEVTQSVLRNIYVFLNSLKDSTKNLKTNYEGVQKAQQSLAKAKNDTAQEKAQVTLNAATSKFNKSLNGTFGNSKIALLAAVKTTFTIWLQTIEHYDFVSDGRTEMQKKLNAAKTKFNQLSTTVKSLAGALQSMKKALASIGEIEIDMALVEEMVDGINLLLDMLEQFRVYYADEGIQKKDIDRLSEKCSLAKNVAKSTAKITRDNSANKQSNRSTATRGGRGNGAISMEEDDYDEDDDYDEYEDKRPRRGQPSSSPAGRQGSRQSARTVGRYDE